MCGKDPKTNKGQNMCINYRMDRPMSRIEEGSTPVIILSVFVIVLMIILFVLFIIFLDCAVLRRVVKLSNSIRQQTKKQHEAFLSLT